MTRRDVSYRLRYKLGTRDATRFPTITYPTRWNPPIPTLERAEILRAAMPDPDKFEIYEVEE